MSPRICGIAIGMQNIKAHFTPHCKESVAASFIITLPVAISIQLLTLVYSIVHSEDSGGCKLCLHVTSAVGKSHYSGQKSRGGSGSPGGTWKLKTRLHRAAMWS